MSKKKNGFGKFLIGGAIGAGLGILFAPKKGSETRKELKQKLDELWCKAKEVDVEELKITFQEKVDEIKQEIMNGKSSIEIRNEALKQKYKPLVVDGIRKIVQGYTTLEELNKKLLIY